MGSKVRTESIMETKKGECFLCLRQGATEVHHCISGHGRRKKADADGLWVNLCVECHRGVHDRNEGEMALKQAAQRAWMKAYRKTEEDWIDRYERNYL